MNLIIFLSANRYKRVTAGVRRYQYSLGTVGLHTLPIVLLDDELLRVFQHEEDEHWNGLEARERIHLEDQGRVVRDYYLAYYSP